MTMLLKPKLRHPCRKILSLGLCYLLITMDLSCAFSVGKYWSHRRAGTTTPQQQRRIGDAVSIVVGGSSYGRSCAALLATNNNEDDKERELDERLDFLAHRLKLEVFDLDEVIYGFDSQDPTYGLEVIHTEISIPTDGSAGLGLVLKEMAGNADGRGLVLIREVSGNALQATSPIRTGDIIIGVRTQNGGFKARTTGLNYDGTVEAIGMAKEEAAALAAATGDAKTMVLCFELNRLVKRAKATVDVQDEKGDFVGTIDALAGENLRRLLLRKGIKLYDERTKRFDMPYSTGDCAGEGLCGTCLVAVKSGDMDALNPKDTSETLITNGRPASWRASCRTVVGSNNQECHLTIRVKPQSAYTDELNPGVKSISDAV